MRWDRFAMSQATDQAVLALFNSNKTLFDGSLVRARHILVAPPAGDSQAQAVAKNRLIAIKADVMKRSTQAGPKLPAQTDNVEKEKTRNKAIEDAFGEFAGKESTCPSKSQGGNLGWFPFSSMVETFAKAAFALRPFEMSDVVTTQFGYHLILVTDR